MEFSRVNNYNLRYHSCYLIVLECSLTVYITVIFHKGIFEIFSPFKSLNLLCWNSLLEYFVFNLFILDYFG